MNPAFRLFPHELHLRYEDESGDTQIIKYPGQHFLVDLENRVFVVDGSNRFPPSTIYTFSDDTLALWLYRHNDAVTTVKAVEGRLRIHVKHERFDIYASVPCSEEAHKTMLLNRDIQADQAHAYMHVHYGYNVPDSLRLLVIEEELKKKTGDNPLEEGRVIW